MFILLMCYFAIRLRDFPYYAPIILILFVIEKKKNIKCKNNEMINNGRIYKVIWSVGFIVALIISFIIPFVLIVYPE